MSSEGGWLGGCHGSTPLGEGLDLETSGQDAEVEQQGDRTAGAAYGNADYGISSDDEQGTTISGNPVPPPAHSASPQGGGVLLKIGVL